MCAMRIQASALAMDFSQSFDRRRHRFSHLPIPTATQQQRDDIEALVGGMIGANDSARVARRPHQKTLHERNAAALQAQIQDKVSSLFGLSRQDMILAKAVPVPA